MAFLSVPDTPNVSLVAFYGNKPGAFRELITFLQQHLLELLRPKIEIYPIEQIHATLIGCEGLRTHKGIVNKWFWEHRKEEKYINLSDFLVYLKTSDRLPISIRIGGYNLETNYDFLSDERHPFERSFQILDNMAVLRGWAFQDNQILRTLNRFRLECQQFNLLHKYHQKSNLIDNNLYMRIGFLKKPIRRKEREIIEQKVRNYLSNIFPIYLTIDSDSLNFIGYQNLSPTLDTTTVIAISDATKEAIEKLYP